MAQDVSRGSYTTKQRLRGKNLAVAVAAAALTELFNFEVGDVQRIFVQVENDGAVAFDKFIISAKSHPEAQWDVLYSVALDFTAPSGLIVGASGDLTTLAAGSRGWFIMDTAGLYAVKAEAEGNAGVATSDAFMSGNGV